MDKKRDTEKFGYDGHWKTPYSNHEFEKNIGSPVFHQPFRPDEKPSTPDAGDE